MKRVIAAMGVALVLSAAPLRLLAQTSTWSDGTTESVVTVDSGELHYRVSKPLPNNSTAWWEYTIALSDVDCLQFVRQKRGDVLSVFGNSNDAVLKKADPNGTTQGYEASLEHIEIDFAPQASVNAEAVVRTITGASHELAKRVNTGACAIAPHPSRR